MQLGKSVFTGECLMDTWNRLEVPTVKSIVLVKHHFRNYKCPEFHDFLLRNRKILEQIHSSAKYISAPTLPTQMGEVLLKVLISFKGKCQSVHPYKMYCISSRLMFFSVFLCIFDLNDFVIIMFVIFCTRN
jgi:hypothetical protein